MISSLQKYVGDNLSCQLQLKEGYKRLLLERVVKTSDESMWLLWAEGLMDAMQVLAGGVHSINPGIGFLPVIIIKCLL